MYHVFSYYLSILGMCPGSCWSLGGHTSFLPPSPLCPLLFISLCGSPSSVIFWCLVSFPQVTLLAYEDKGNGRLHSLAVARPSPCPPLLLFHARTVWATQFLLLFPASPSPHIVLISSPRLKFWGRSARRNVQTQHSSKRLLGLLNLRPIVSLVSRIICFIPRRRGFRILLFPPVVLTGTVETTTDLISYTLKKSFIFVLY